MKKIVLLLIAIVFTIAACVKKKSTTSCYICNRYQVTYSSYQVLAVPNHLYATDTLCNMNDGLITQYTKTHSYYDTVKNSHDTLTYIEHYVTCDNQ